MKKYIFPVINITKFDTLVETSEPYVSALNAEMLATDSSQKIFNINYEEAVDVFKTIQ